MSDPAAPLWIPWPAVANLCFENRPTGHRKNTDNPAKWSQTCLLAERRSPGHRCSPSFTNHVYKLCLFIGQCCFSELTRRPSHTTKPRCALGCTRRKISNTTYICLTAARGQMQCNLCAHVVLGRSRRAPPAATDR